MPFGQAASARGRCRADGVGCCVPRSKPAIVLGYNGMSATLSRGRAEADERSVIRQQVEIVDER